MPFLYRLSFGHTISIIQLRQAVHKIVIKHESLRTSLTFDKQNNQLTQQVIDYNDKNNNLFSFIESIFETDEQLNQIIYDEQRNTQLFNLNQGLVFRCHLVYYKQISSNDLLGDKKDQIIFNFHHASFDVSSMGVFLNDLNQVYTTDQLTFDDNTTLRYLDYAHIEQQMSMTVANMFWLDTLHDYKLDQSLSLPFDRYRLENDCRTGYATSISFDFCEHLSHVFLTYSSSNNITLQHLAFTCFYAFLFKLTNGEKDLCIGININIRFKEELMSIIGMFGNTIPLRCQLDPHWSFHQLLEHVREIITNSLKYAYFPLQRILNQHPNASKASFLDISFEFQPNGIEKRKNEIRIGDNQLCLIPFSNKISEDEIMSRVDFALIIQHDLEMNQFSCTINASLDLFNRKTVEKISQQFHSMLKQLFSFYDDDQIKKPLYELSLISPDERLLMKSMNNTEVLFPSLTCIHHAFINQAMEHPQKLAVELDEQSLTYAELLYYVQVLSLNLLSEQRVIVSDIVCQCVERSLSMVIGMMAIVMVCGVYCPLSPRDPQHRLYAILQQTQSRLVLLHHLTKTKFNDDVNSIDIDLFLVDSNVLDDVHLERLSNILVTPDNIAYIIFTSGSTGTPKAVQVRHGNFTSFMYSFIHTGILTINDVALQMAACTFDAHVQEIVGSLICNATIIMLHPHGNMEFVYLLQTLKSKQVTHLIAVPTLLHQLCDTINNNHITDPLVTIQSLCCVGETLFCKVVKVLTRHLAKTHHIWNLYGPAEATLGSTYHLIDVEVNIRNIQIGRPFLNYQCMIMNEFLQPCSTNQDSELCIGGVGVFAGYLGRDDLTEKALVEIDGEVFYRTGDLVRMDNASILHYIGRKDFQIKLHGQRIELGEIEQCLLEHTSISACVVIKWDHDHLVAYVQKSLDINENELREHCQSHLPLHMIPSVFIILDKLPLNANGKIDRKLLPSPSSAHLLPLNQTNNLEIKLPNDEIQALIHTLWCDMFHQKQISIDTNIFTIGGHSLLLMQLYHQYKTTLHLETKSLSISDLFQYPTMIDHAQLIHQAINTEQHFEDCWSSLHVNQGKNKNKLFSSFPLCHILARASFAQERIFLDEQIRFSSQNNNMIYAIPLLYRISSLQSHVSITGLQHALQSVIMKHNILRTALYFDSHGTIIQQVNTVSDSEDMKSYGFEIINLRNDNINKTIDEILNHSQLFDLSKGNVIDCHILRRSRPDYLSLEKDEDLLMNDDMVLFNIHHSAFDGASTSVFLRDLSVAYESSCSLCIDDNTFQYLDYSVYEHQMDLSRSRDFWHSQLEGYNLERQLSLPVDQHRFSTNQRSSLSSKTQISFNNDQTTSFLNYASSHHLTLFQLGLSCFYAFLFKLTHGQNDLSVASLNANRYKAELQNMIGMFVSTLPYRIQLNPRWPCDDLVRHVRDNCLSILEHSHYPLQHILADFHVNQSNVPFLETVFDFITVSSDTDELTLIGTDLKQMSLEESSELAKFDFMLTFLYNPTLEDGRLSCQFVCSRDLYEEKTVGIIARRFEYLFEQLFTPKAITNEMDQCVLSIPKLSLILPEENEEMQEVVFCRQANVTERAPASFAQARIWHDEQTRFHVDKSPLAIYNMPFLFHLSSGLTLSIIQLRQALHNILIKHQALHTSLTLDKQNNQLTQQIIDYNDKNNNLFSCIESIFETDEQLNNIIYNEQRNSQLFDLAQGLVFRCHIIYYAQISSNDLLSDKDLIIFNFHHAMFDFPSMDVFLHDLNQFYTIGQLISDDSTGLRYLDYANIEQHMPMTAASMFWLDTLHDYKLDQSLSLPFDRYPLENEHRTGQSTSISFDFGEHLSRDLQSYSSANNTKLEHLAFAGFYALLFKLTNGEKDLCVGINPNTRFNEELMSIIGMFDNIIPLRCQLDSHWSFRQLLEHVQEITTNTLEYSYFPLQRILNQHSNISKAAFLDISFEFQSDRSQNRINEIMIGDSQLSSIPFSNKFSEDEIMTKFDFALIIQDDPNMTEFSCTINASLDLFNAKTIEKISQQFHSMLKQIFSFTDNQKKRPIYEFSLITLDERLLMKSMNNTQVLFPFLTCIHHQFVNQTMKHPQKLAVELDEQSLTYAELLYYVQLLSLNLVNEQRVIVGKVICQCVERSLSMVIGMMAIEMVGGVYCPLSPRDPQHRLYSLLQQTQSRLVLNHHLTKTKFTDDIISLDIDLVLTSNDMESDVDADRLSNIIVTPQSIAYIIFTSGSTGTPKAVQVRHENFSECIHSLIYVDTFNENDTVVQMARCSFDIHVQEILGILTIGATLFMLHPGETMDFDYLSEVLETKQITYMHTVPSLLHSFFTFVEECNNKDALRYLRSLCSIGEPFSVKLITLIINIAFSNCKVWNLYGPAETTIASTFHLVNVLTDRKSIPIGIPLSNYRCVVMDEFLQSSIVGQDGELYIGGVGVFAGYLGRDDLTTKALVEINGEIFYRTGDLVRMDIDGRLHHRGRKDHQIKLHGQRIELGEIEQCLLEHTAISACVVIKWNDDHLIVYVQKSCDINEKELREHCQSRLPPYMIPSLFIILDKLPLNANGKIDRKALPAVDFDFLSVSSNETDQPLTEMERRLIIFEFVIAKGPASYVQTSVWLAERIRFKGWPQVSAYNMPTILQVDSGYFSINKCVKVLNEIVSQHWIFRTRLTFDVDRGYLRQTVHQQISYPIRLSTYNDEKEKERIISEEVDIPFDTEHDGVFRCHFIRRYNHEQEDKLCTNDVIIFNFHHGSFDGRALDLFLEQFKLAYECKQLQPPHLQYIDYSIHERKSLMKDARNYWNQALKDYAWDRRLDLGARETSLLSARRRDQGSSLRVKISSDIARSMIKRADQLNITLFQLGLTCFYLYLAQISSHNRDACIGIIHLNRYRPELTSIIGMFVNVLPCRISIDILETISFIELIDKVQQIFLTITQHAHLPYDQLIDLHRAPNSYLQLPFLQTIFRVDTDAVDYNHMNGIILDDSCHLSPYSLQHESNGGKFDLEVSLIYDKTTEAIDCTWSYLLDAFEKSIIDAHANHFNLLLTQLFESNSHTQLQLPLSKIIRFKKENTINYQENNLSTSSVGSIVETHQKQEFINRIRNVFCRVLGCTVTDINDDKSFFEQGGTSLKALQVITLLQQHVSFQIDTQDFFDHPSVAHIAQTISKS
ncbi:unnamed protein product [Adineta steineri]|uniref:Carrier domain-containing protein n=1 Tax=Adineta steineri TaxID=433720 RepID=A0A814VQW0_9BILA|nr:unnamed protein product [Adineta steineri]